MVITTSIKTWFYIEKVHKLIHFKQSHWLKPYIDLNTKFRTDSDNDFEKDLFKLINSLIFGKTYSKKSKNQKDIWLATNEKQEIN